MLVYGIWILPHGEFGDDKFISDAKQQVRDVMSWSKNYDCIITYLIMNEPMPGHIFEQGAENTVNLWVNLRDIIHEQHPGIPVTISNNSAIGEYINENIFDVYGYNTYDYHEGLPGHTQSFSNHFSYLKDLNGQNKPVLVTEFGLSVSPIGWGVKYGGQTRNTQATHIIQNFREVLNSGVAGICPFYYADGWWKAGEPGIHNPWPEEWFGYWGYADTVGYPRPIWHEFKEYNQAIIGSPRSHNIYGKEVPVELYLNEDVHKLRVVYNDKVIFDKDISGYYYNNFLKFEEDETGLTFGLEYARQLFPRAAGSIAVEWSDGSIERDWIAMIKMGVQPFENWAHGAIMYIGTGIEVGRVDEVLLEEDEESEVVPLEPADEHGDEHAEEGEQFETEVDAVMRLGLGWVFHAGNFSIIPNINSDIVGEDWALVGGVTIGYRF